MTHAILIKVYIYEKLNYAITINKFFKMLLCDFANNIIYIQNFSFLIFSII